MILNCNGLPQKRLYFKRRVWHNIKQNLSILYSGSFFLVPSTHVRLEIQTCLRLHFVAREEQSSVMKTCWQDKNCLSPTCDLCFWMCVAASSRRNRSSGAHPWGCGPSTRAQRSFISVTVCKQQLLPEAFPGYFWPFLTTFRDLKDKANLRKAMRKSWKIHFEFVNKTCGRISVEWRGWRCCN